jgi:rhodanese-related sulfurtransferase
MRSVVGALLSVLLAAAVLVTSSCDSSEATGTVVQVKPVQAVKLIARGDHVVLDVRTAEDFAAGHVAGAVHLDAQAADFEERVRELDPAVPYLVYARSRERSAPTADRLVRLGGDRVADAGAFGLLAIAGAELE